MSSSITSPSPRLAIKTFGCKANSVDTDYIQQAAQAQGFVVVDEEQSADAYLINSCTVTSHADRDARAQVSRFKRQNPQAVVGVIGCYAQIGKEELLALPDVDVVMGTSDKLAILNQLRARINGKQVARDQVSPTAGFLPEAFQGSRYARATLKIQDGCNFSCSFCIIPKARGRSRSLRLGNVLDQIDQAYAQGFQEVILTGIHLAHYGWDLGSDLMTLLKKATSKAQGPRLRVSTLDPFEISDEFIALLASTPRICRHLHIALQSGSDPVLAKMRRIYKAEEFAVVTEKLMRAVPDLFIGVDVIVGFPGETDEEFEVTRRFLERTAWTKLHVFSYSERPDTRAALSDEKVPAFKITERSEILRRLSDERYEAFLQSQVGTVQDVVFERPSRKEGSRWLGHTGNYLPTLSLDPEAGERRLRRARITAIEAGRAVTTPA